MVLGNLPPQSRRADYIETLELTSADAPHDLTDLNAAGLVSAGSAAIRKLNSETDLVSVSWGAGLTSPSLGILQWWFAPSALLGLPAGNYRLLVSLTASGQAIELVDAVLPLT